jgi:hypothetical protein
VPFIGDMAGGGDGPRAVPHDAEAWAGVGPARRWSSAAWPAAARPRHSRATRTQAAHDRR